MTPLLQQLRRRQVFIVCILLFGLVVWTFLPATKNGFINYDDDVYVAANPHVQAGLDATTIAWAFTSIDASNWHPLTWLSHMADCQFYGLRPAGHHLSSILIHSASAVLVFLLLRRMTGATWRSLFVAAAFGLHPLRVESVAWVAERKDVLSTLFGLITLLMYANYADKKSTPKPGAGIFYGVALLFFAASLMSKPMLVTLPFVLLLLDYWPLDRWRREGAGKLVREKVPFLLLTVASCAVTYVAQQRGGAMVLMAAMPFAARCENALVSYGRYLGKLFWPENLAVVYPVVDQWPMQVVLLATVVLAGISVLCWTARRAHPYLVTGWFWFLGELVPVIGLVAIGEQAMADRYTYFPTIGVLIMVAWAAEELTRRWRHQTIVLSATSAAVILACILLTRENIRYWRTSETLFRHVVAVTGDNYSAHCSLGNALMADGRLEEALVEFQTAAKLKPGSPENLCNVGVALASMDRLDEAIVEFQNATKLKPDFGLAHHNLGMAFERKGQLDQATHEYEEAVSLMPNYAPAHNSLGVARAKQSRLDEAVAQFREAVRLDPSLLAAQNNLKMALELKSR